MAGNRQFESREWPESPQTLAGGVNDYDDETLLAPNQSSAVSNIEFDRKNVTVTGGALKLNNQVAPSSAIQTQVDPGLAPLPMLAVPLAGTGNGLLGVCEVPARGAAFFPYVSSSDIGGQFISEGDLMTSTEVFHIRRGRSFELNISFRIPPEEKLYATPTLGSLAPLVPALPMIPPDGFDEALDECFCIIQKGGDRLTPMSWALAVVNVGNFPQAAHGSAQRVSNYALCFIWYDAPQWGEWSPSVMKYDLVSGEDPLAGAGSQFSTQAYRAVVIHKYVEPNVDYSVSIQLQMDSGTCGTTTVPSDTAWNDDGFFKAQVWDNRTTYTSYSFDESNGPKGVDIFKGPADSLSYLCKYGIRYAGKDARFAGMGNRFIPWMRCGFVPFGADLAPLRAGGFSMVDRSSTSPATLYGAGTYTLTAQHVAGNSYVTVNVQGLRDANFGLDPKGGQVTLPFWLGLNAPNCNPEALSGYRFVTTNDFAANQRGAVLTLLDYTEVGASYRFNIYQGANAANFGTFNAAGQLVLIQCFRWHQREIVVGQFRTWALPRAYGDTNNPITSGRRQMGLRSSVVLSDETEPDIATLQECYPCDDAGGAVLREIVVGGPRQGFLIPLGNAVSISGENEEKSLFLSGEGEALTLDLSEDPTFKREIHNMLAGSTQGFGFEISFTPLEAVYALPVLVSLPDDTTGALQGLRPRLAPDLIVWDVKDATTLGTRAVPRPLLTLGHRGMMVATDPVPFRRPFALTVEVGTHSDQEDIDPIAPQALNPWWRDGAAVTHARYDPTAPWVGRRVTVQVGVQSDGVSDEYDVYIALSPKDAFMPANGDPADAEHQWWTDSEANTTNLGAGALNYAVNYFKTAHLKIKRKDIARSVLTVGGRWNCKPTPSATTNLGVSELNARMLVHEVRWFGCSPGGALAPYVNGSAISLTRNGKLEGTNALPQGPLSSSDIEQQLGPGVDSATLTTASSSVTPAGATSFFAAESRNSQRAVKGHYLLVSGDEYKYGKDETQKVTKRDYYAISAVAADGSSLTLTTPYQRPTRKGAVASCFALLGYTRFEDDVRDRPLLLARGSGYDILTTNVSQVVLTDELWANKAPTQGGWKLRIYSPFGGRSPSELLPVWTRGVVTERRIVDDGILGLHGFNSKIYAGVRGALYEADDRWRFDGPSEDITTSIHFRSYKLPADVTTGLHNDRVVYTNTSQMQLQGSATDTYCSVFDAWVNPDTIGQFQTIAWIGQPASNPALPSNATGHVFHVAMRLNRGRPELCVGSTAFFTGATIPEKGVFTATARQALEADRWSHVRFYLFTDTGGTVFLKPYCKINGKHADVGVNAIDTGVAGALQWLRSSTVVNGGATMWCVVGCGRDSYVSPDSNASFSATGFQGTLTLPQRLQGWMHSFNGKIALVALSHQPSEGSVEPADFDPFSLSYDLPGVVIQMVMQGDGDGVGHRLHDQTGTFNQPLIQSHPFVSVFHEMGSSNALYSFTEYGDQMYVTNGGKPVVVLPSGTAKLAGVPAPLVAPTFATDRFPLWKKNVRVGTGTNDQNDPVASAASGAAQQTYHYNAVGNAFWRQALTSTEAAAMSWSKEGYFFLKFYFRPHRVDGRIQLWRKGAGAGVGGPFLEVKDGRIRFGWYDTDLKTDVYVESTNVIVQPNRLHYIYVRKRWPTNDAIDGNWESSFWTNGKIRRATFTGGIAGTFAIGEVVNFTAGGGVAGSGVVTKTYGASASTMEFILAAAGGGTPGATSAYTGVTSGATGTTSVAAVRPTKDSLVVGVFKYSAESALFGEDFLQIDAANDVRASTSLTTDAYGIPAGTNGTGLVSPPGLKYTGLATGAVICQSPANHLAFYRSMVGMYWIWGASAPASIAGRRYRIVGLTDAAGLSVATVSGIGIQVAVVETDAAYPINFAAIAVAIEGGVFRGNALKKSTAYDISKSPDKSSTVVEFMGTEDQGGALSGFSAFDGETWTPGWGVVTPGTAGVDPTTFETASATDPILTGTDGFKAENYDSTGANKPDALQFQPGAQIGQWDGRAYAGAAPATSQPNTDLAIRRTNPAITSTSSEGEPFWNYNQEPGVWAESRYVAVAFYDPEQDVVGNPSPLLLMQPTQDDNTNPSGSVQTTLSNLPVGRAGVELWIYLSAAGGSAGALFRVAKVANGTASVPLRFSEVDVISGPALEFTNSEPPRCSLVRAISAYMVYGALEALPTGILPSRPAAPAQVDFSKLFRFPGGTGDAITALYELDGLGVAMKRRAIGSFSFDASGNAIVGQVSGGVGAVSNQSVQAKDNLLFFFSDAGLQVTYRQGVTNLGRPQFIGENVQTFTQEEIDRMRLDRVSSAISRSRGTYIAIAKQADDARSLTRVSVIFTDQQSDQTVCSFYRYPALSCIASVQSKDGGIERLVGGTEEGFVVWLDDARTTMALMGEDPRIWGGNELSIVSGSTSAVDIGDATVIDLSLEGPRGVTMHYLDADGAAREVSLLGAETTHLHFAEIAQSAPAPLEDVSLGSLAPLWESAWVDMGNPRIEKVLYDTTLVFRDEPSGEAQIDLFGDFDTDTVIQSETIDLTEKKQTVIWKGAAARRFKVRISSPQLASMTKFTLASIVWRVSDITQEGSS